MKLEEGRVTFRYKDDADQAHAQMMTLDAQEFLRRFVQHVLPSGFVKVRHYGLLANRFRAQRLALARRLLLALVAPATPTAPDACAAFDAEPLPERCCVKCGSRRLECRALPRSPANTS